MPSLNKSILILAAITQAAFVLAAPIPQLAGEGNACSSILSSTDNGIGYGIENAEGTYYFSNSKQYSKLTCPQTTRQL